MMSTRTVFLSKLIGFSFVFIALAMFMQRASTLQMMSLFVRDAPLMYLAGLLALVAGLAMILSHNIWSGGAAAVIVTLVGWLVFIKGLLTLFISPDAMVRLYQAVQFESFSSIWATIVLLVGAYLTYSGFVAAAKTPSAQR